MSFRRAPLVVVLPEPFVMRTLFRKTNYSPFTERMETDCIVIPFAFFFFCLFSGLQCCFDFFFFFLSIQSLMKINETWSATFDSFTKAIFSMKHYLNRQIPPPIITCGCSTGRTPAVRKWQYPLNGCIDITF